MFLNRSVLRTAVRAAELNCHFQSLPLTPGDLKASSRASSPKPFEAPPPIQGAGGEPLADLYREGEAPSSGKSLFPSSQILPESINLPSVG